MDDGIYHGGLLRQRRREMEVAVVTGFPAEWDVYIDAGHDVKLEGRCQMTGEGDFGWQFKQKRFLEKKLIELKK